MTRDTIITIIITAEIVHYAIMVLNAQKVFLYDTQDIIAYWLPLSVKLIVAILGFLFVVIYTIVLFSKWLILKIKYLINWRAKYGMDKCKR